MCTVTMRRRGPSWLVTMNRDEAKTRSEAEPPFAWRDPDMLAPRDPDAGGTWIGLRRDGVWACLLNGYLADEAERDLATPKTRGRIVPLALRADWPVDAIKAEDLTSTSSFRLLIGGRTRVMDLFWTGRQLTISERPDATWDLVTSSSLDQETVTRDRESVLAQFVEDGAPIDQRGIPRLHLDRYGLDPERAILMDRSHASTVSCTQMRIENGMATMRHWPRRAMLNGAAVEVEF